MLLLLVVVASGPFPALFRSGVPSSSSREASSATEIGAADAEALARAVPAAWAAWAADVAAAADAHAADARASRGQALTGAIGPERLAREPRPTAAPESLACAH